jgi:hypothetical protein
MLPETGTTPKNPVIDKLRDKGIGEKKTRAFLDEHTSASGPIYEWRIKRSGKRDDIHLAQHPQPDLEHQRQRYWKAAANNADNGFR